MQLITRYIYIVKSLRKYSQKRLKNYNNYDIYYHNQILEIFFFHFLIVWAIGSAVEHSIDSRRVIGSNPILPTIFRGYSLVGAYPVCIRKAAVRFCLPPPLFLVF